MAEKKPLTGMPCEEFTQLASAGFEVHISFRDRMRMLWHKIECIYCRRFLNQIKKIRRLLAAEGSPKPMPAAMKEAIDKKLRGRA